MLYQMYIIFHLSFDIKLLVENVSFSALET